MSATRPARPKSTNKTQKPEQISEVIPFSSDIAQQAVNAASKMIQTVLEKCEEIAQNKAIALKVPSYAIQEILRVETKLLKIAKPMSDSGETSELDPTWNFDQEPVVVAAPKTIAQKLSLKKTVPLINVKQRENLNLSRRGSLVDRRETLNVSNSTRQESASPNRRRGTILIKPVNPQVKLTLEPQQEMSDKEIYARKYLEQVQIKRKKEDEFLNLQNRKREELGFAQQEKIKEQEKLIKSGKFTYTENGQIMPTKPCNAEKLTNFTTVNFLTKQPRPSASSKVVVKLTVAQRTNRLQQERMQTIEKENQQQLANQMKLMVKNQESDDATHGCCFEQLQASEITKGVSLKLDEQVHVGMLQSSSEVSRMTRTQYNSISRAQTARFRTAALDLTIKDSEKPQEVVSAKNIRLSELSGSKNFSVVRQSRNKIIANSSDCIAELIQGAKMTAWQLALEKPAPMAFCTIQNEGTKNVRLSAISNRNTAMQSNDSSINNKSRPHSNRVVSFRQRESQKQINTVGTSANDLLNQKLVELGADNLQLNFELPRLQGFATLNVAGSVALRPNDTVKRLSSARVNTRLIQK